MAPDIVEVGEEVMVTVKAEHADDIYSFDLFLGYDAEVFELVDVEIGDNEGNFQLLSYKDNDGEVRIVAQTEGVSGVSGEGIGLAYAIFRAKGPVSYTHLDVYKRQHQCHSCRWPVP